MNAVVFAVLAAIAVGSALGLVLKRAPEAFTIHVRLLATRT